MGSNTAVEMYDVEEAASYVRDAAPEDCDVIDNTVRDHDFAVEWYGNNRMDVFEYLLAHGWVVTSVDSTFTWFERIDHVDDVSIDVEVK